MKLKGKVAATTLAGLMVTGIGAPAWGVDPTDAALDQYADMGPRPVEFDDVLGTWVAADRLGSAFVVVTPGTDDTGLAERTAGLVGDRTNRIIKYPESIWPLASGKSDSLLPLFAPTYDESKEVAVSANLEMMRALAGAPYVVVYTGYSQGADALGNAAERAEPGLLGENTLILLVSDPRGPWGLKAGLAKIPFSAPVMALVGAKSDGARDPADTGAAQVVQVIVKGDPVADWQWNPLRPVSSLLVDLAGFITIHAGTGPYSYANLDGLTLEKTLYSADGNTTYEVYDTYHPLALVNWMIADALGFDVDEEQLKEWDRQAELFYPLQEISPETAAPGVKVVTDQPAGRHRLVDGNGDHVQAPDVVTTGAGAYVPRHAAPDTDLAPADPEAQAAEPVPTAPETTGAAATAPETTATETTAPETTGPAATATDATESGTTESGTTDSGATDSGATGEQPEAPTSADDAPEADAA